MGHVNAIGNGQFVHTLAMAVSWEQLEGLASKFSADGDLLAAAKCYACALLSILPSEDECRIRFKYGVLLMGHHPNLAFEQLERALRLCRHSTRFRVGIVCALLRVSQPSLVNGLIKDYINDVEASNVVAYMIIIVHCALRHRLDCRTILEFVERLLVGFPENDNVRLLALMYALIVDANVDSFMQSIDNMNNNSPFVTFLKLANSIANDDHASSERVCRDLINCKLNTLQLSEGVCLFPKYFRHAIRALCIIQSAIDGKTPHSELCLVGDRLIAKTQATLIASSIRKITDCILYLDGVRIAPNDLNIKCSFNQVFDFANNQQLSCQSKYSNYVEFIHSCKMIISSSFPLHHIKSQLLAVLKHVNTVSQDAFIRSSVMLLLGQIYSKTDPELSEKMLLVACKFATLCSNEVILSFINK